MDITRRVVSTSIAYPPEALTDFLRRFEGQPRFHWAGDGIEFAAAGIAARLRADGPERFESIKAQVDDLFTWLIHDAEDLPNVIGPKVFGGFAFSPQHTAQGEWRAFSGAQFVLPRYLLTHRDDGAWLTVIRVAEQNDDLDAILHQLEADTRHLPPTMLTPRDTAATTSHDAVTPEAWATMIDEATARISAGQLEKVVLSRSRRVQTDISLPAVLARLAADYPNCYRFLFEFEPGDAFFGATPEVLVRVKHPRIETVALAGSIARGATPAEDQALAQQLMVSTKDRHEHQLVVDAIRNAMDPITTAVFIDDEPALHKLANIQHLSTPIYGWLERGENLLDLVERLHPTPALGGHPRKVALSLIAELEPHERGWYGAPVGWLSPDGGGLFAVAIRSAVKSGDRATLYAGAGIVADSQPDSEWRETNLKFRPMAEALQ